MKYIFKVKLVQKGVFDKFIPEWTLIFDGLPKNVNKTVILPRIFLKFSEMVGRELFYQEIFLAELGIFFCLCYASISV
jgi:hypothetical protein